MHHSLVMFIEQTRKGDWAVWDRNRKYLARFDTETEAEAYARPLRQPVTPYVRPEPKLTKMEASVLATIEGKGGEVIWPGLSDATQGLIRKGKATSERTAEGQYRIALA